MTGETTVAVHPDPDRDPLKGKGYAAHNEAVAAVKALEDFRVSEYKRILKLVQEAMQGQEVTGKDAASLANEARIAALELAEIANSWDPMPVLNDLDAYCSEWMESAGGSERSAVSKAWRAILKTKAEIQGTGRTTIMDQYAGRGNVVQGDFTGRTNKAGDMGKRNSGPSSTRGKKGTKGK